MTEVSFPWFVQVMNEFNIKIQSVAGVLAEGCWFRRDGRRKCSLLFLSALFSCGDLEIFLTWHDVLVLKVTSSLSPRLLFPFFRRILLSWRFLGNSGRETNKKSFLLPIQSSSFKNSAGILTRRWKRRKGGRQEERYNFRAPISLCSCEVRERAQRRRNVLYFLFIWI